MLKKILFQNGTVQQETCFECRIES